MPLYVYVRLHTATTEQAVALACTRDTKRTDNITPGVVYFERRSVGTTCFTSVINKFPPVFFVSTSCNIRLKKIQFGEELVSWCY